MAWDWDSVPIELWNEISSFLGLQDVLSLRCVHRAFPLQRASCSSACGHVLARLPAAVASLDLRKAPYSTTTWRAFFQASPTAELTELRVHHSNIPYNMLAHSLQFARLQSLVLIRCIDFPEDDATAPEEWRFCLVNSVLANLPSLQQLVLRDNQLWITTSQVLQLVRKLQHLDLSYNLLVHDVDAFPTFCSRCHVLKLDYLFFGKALFTAFLNAVRFPVLRDLAVVSCAEDMASCLAGADLRSLQTLTIHRDPTLPLLLPHLPNLQHLSAGRMWSYADLPQPLGCTIDVGLTDIQHTTKPTKIVRLILEHPTEDVAGFLIHQCPHLQYLDTSSWSPSSMYALIRQLFRFEKRLPVKYWKTPYLQDAAAHAYYLYISECPNVNRIHRVVPSHPGVFADAFFPPNHFFHSILHLNLSYTAIRPEVCIELFTWLYCGSFRNLATLDLSGNEELDDGVFQFLRLPSSFRHFSLAYQDTSATPWSLFDLLHAHRPHAFSRVSVMTLDDSIVQVKSVLYAVGHGHLTCLPRHLAVPALILSQLPKYIVKQLNQHCCEVVAIHDT